MEVDLSVLSPIEFGDDRHIYHQIADQIRGLIRDGILAAGDRIPSENEMTRVYGCARPTVRQARDLLEREGWIKTERGRGAFVVGVPPS
jgi:DNA-binding GntR family transcriptional regulator